MSHVLNKFKLLRPLWIVGLISFSFSQDKEERTPLWIEKDDIIISIKPNALMSLKSSDTNDEKIIKYFDVDHKMREIYCKQEISVAELFPNGLRLSFFYQLSKKVHGKGIRNSVLSLEMESKESI